MQTKKRKALLVATLAASSLAVAAIAITTANGSEFVTTRANPETYAVTLNGSNGNASVSSLKTNSVTAQTALKNNVVFDYKNMQVVSGKIGTIMPKGHYYNKEPLNAMNSIKVTSNATAGKATLYWGPTSGYMPNHVDLADASTDVPVSGNFFKIVAKDEVTIDSINIGFECDTKNYGAYALDSDGNPVENGFTFKWVSDHYEMLRGTGNSSVVTAILPDFYDDGTNGLAPVTATNAKSNDGCFDSYSNLANVYLSNNFKTSGNYNFYGSLKVKELTLPLYYESATSHVVPSSLETLNLNSRSLTVSSTKISSSNPLKTINVSYDVEKLPKLADSWPSALVINYEGTQAEWSSLLNASGSDSSWKNFTGDVICSDTTISSVTFSFEGATLGGDTDSKVVSVITGKTVANPGSPVPADASKRFEGWFDAATGGNEFDFSTPIAADTTVYAHFGDYPAGGSIDNAIAVTVGENYDFTNAADMPYGYFKYTAEVDTVLFGTVTSGTTDYVYLRANNADGSTISTVSANSADDAVKASPAITSSYGVGEYIRMRVGAGETAYMSFGDTTRFGTFNVAFSAATADDAKDYTTAKVMSSDSITMSVARKGITWAKFTSGEAGSYYVTNTSAKWAGLTIGTIADGAFTTVKSLNASYGTSEAVISLTANTTYYLAFTCNSNDTEATFTVSSDLPEGADKSSAIAIATDGANHTVTYSSTFPTTWFKFDVAADGQFRLTSEKRIYPHDASSYSYPRFKLEDADGNVYTYAAGRTDYDKVYTLTAGTYYLSIITNSSNTGFTFNVTPVADEVTVNVYGNGPDTTPTSTIKMDAGSTYELADLTYVSNGVVYYTGFGGWFTDASLTTPFVSGSVINENTDIYAKFEGKYRSDMFNWLDSQFPSQFDEIYVNSSTDYQFVKNSDGEIVSTNQGIKSSYSSFRIVFASDTFFSFDWAVSSESSDKFHVYSWTAKGGSRTAIVESGGEASGRVNQLFTAGMMIEIDYYKDSSVDKGSDTATITNIACAPVTHYTLTCVPNNGGENIVINDVIGGTDVTSLLPEVSYADHGFAGWYSDEGLDTPFVAAEGINADTTIYAKWVNSAIQAGSYTGFNLYSTGQNPASPWSLGKSIVVDNSGNVTGDKTGKITDIENAGANTIVGSSTYYMYFNEDEGIIAVSYSASTNTLGTDMNIMFSKAISDKSDIKYLRYGATSGSNYTALLEVTYSDSSVCYILVFNDAIYDNVTWDEEVAFGDLTTSTPLTVKDKSGNVIFTKA